MSDTDIIWLLIFIGYAIGFIGIAILGILGTNEIVEFKNRQYKQEAKLDKIGLSKAFEKAKKL